MTIRYVESETPQDQHRHQGWFWHLETQCYYRWNDLMSLYGRDYFNTELSSGTLGGNTFPSKDRTSG